MIKLNGIQPIHLNRIMLNLPGFAKSKTVPNWLTESPEMKCSHLPSPPPTCISNMVPAPTPRYYKHFYLDAHSIR
jgi:hypothetical protein